MEHMRRIEIHHRTEVGRTTVRHYDSTGVFERSERFDNETTTDATIRAYITADDVDFPVTFAIDGVEFVLTAGGAK